MLRSLAPSAFFLLLLAAAAGHASDLTVGDALAGGGGVQVEKVRFSGGTVRGSIANTTAAEVSEVKLLIRYVWAWKNERHPGEDNPGRSEYDEVEGPIAPGSSIAFEHVPVPPLPANRTDGSFRVEAAVVGFAQVER